MLTKPKNPIGEPLQAERMGDGNLHMEIFTWRNAHEGKVTQLNSSLTEVWSKLFTRDKGNSGLTRQPT